MFYRIVVSCIGLALAVLVASPHALAAGERATGTLVSGAGVEVGRVTLEQGVDGVTLLATARGLAPGLHGIHIHAVGKCDGPDFMSAGGHFNPGNKQHGLNNPAGAHGGDLANLSAASDGAANYRGFTNGLTLSAGSSSVFDADGAAVVIHANPDDNVTDPAGNSGPRIACAVLTLAPAAMPRTGEGGSTTPLGSLVLTAASLALISLGLARRRRVQG